MKKFLLVTLAMLVFASVSFAQFSPTQLVLYNAPTEVAYDFDGSAVDIDFEVQNLNATVWLIITTKDKAEDIVAVRNGNLGWHYVNKCDTTVYVSEGIPFTPGNATITWDGTNADGALVDAGAYYYYLWAFDHVSSRVTASNFIGMSSPQGQKRTNLHDYNPVTGEPIMDVWFSNFQRWDECEGLPADAADGVTKMNDVSTWTWYRNNVKGTVCKWNLGGEPSDPTLLQKTLVYGDEYFPYGEESPYYIQGGCFDPRDETNTTFFMIHISNDENLETMYKFDFVNGDLADKDETWGGFDNIEWQNKGAAGDPSFATPFTDGEYMYWAGRGLEVEDQEYNPIYCCDFDGEMKFEEVNVPNWYFPEAVTEKGNVQRTFRFLDIGPNTSNILLAETNCCITQLIDPTGTIEDPDTADPDMIVWENSNGDNFVDINTQPEDTPQWQCICDRHYSGAVNVIYASTQDRYGIPLFGIGHSDLLSMALMTNDGTGVAYLQFGDDTIVTSYFKGVVDICDNDSQWDGIYCNNRLDMENGPRPDGHWYGNLMCSYCGWDNFQGVITNAPTSAVADADDAAFAVDAPYPNPANPTTTIGFSIPESGLVSIDVYNVAGQKVDTLVNDVMNAGKHSVVWDADGFSAGVYFYTVKSGDFSKTMKVTILK